MEDFVRKLEKIPLSGDNFLRMINRSDCEYIYYDDLAKKQTLFSKWKKILGVLYDIKNENSGHWILLWRERRGHVDILHYFDSYGTSYLKDLSLTHNKDNLTRLIKNYKLIENNFQYQKEKSYINICTRHISCKAKFCELDEKSYKRLLEHNKYDFDGMVTLLTAFASEKNDLYHIICNLTFLVNFYLHKYKMTIKYI